MRPYLVLVLLGLDVWLMGRVFVRAAGGRA